MCSVLPKSDFSSDNTTGCCGLDPFCSDLGREITEDLQYDLHHLNLFNPSWQDNLQLTQLLCLAAQFRLLFLAMQLTVITFLNIETLKLTQLLCCRTLLAWSPLL